MKRLISIVFVSFCAISIFAAGEKEAGTRQLEVFKVKAFGWEGVDYGQFAEAFHFVKETFGLDIDMASLTGMHAPIQLEKPELIWVSGDYPEFFDFYIGRIELWNYPGIWDKLQDWRPLVDKIPNVRAHFSDFEWNDMIRRRSRPDGKLPYMPGHNYRTATSAWCYEKNTFDKLDIAPPLTLDDLYQALQTLRSEYEDPAYFFIGGRNYFFNIVFGIAFAHRMEIGIFLGADNLYFWNPYYQDPDTGELTFSGSTPKFLKTLKYCRKLMEEGLAPDMTTVMDEGLYWSEAAANLHVLMSFGPTKDALKNYDRAAEPNHPDVDWQELWTPIRANAATPALVPYTPPDWDNGTFITDKAGTGAMRDQILAYINFLAQKREGSPFTYESLFALDEFYGRPTWIVNDDPNVGRVGAVMYPQEWKLEEPSPGRDTTRSPWWGEHGDGETTGWFVPSQWPYRTPFISTIYSDYDPLLQYAEGVKAGAGEFTVKLVWAKTPQEDLKLQELEGAIATIMDNFIRGFLHGEFAEDDWDNYISELQKAGLDEAFEIRKEIYERNN